MSGGGEGALGTGAERADELPSVGIFSLEAFGFEKSFLQKWIRF